MLPDIDASGCLFYITSVSQALYNAALGIVDALTEGPVFHH